MGNAVRLSGRRLLHFLEELRTKSDAETIHIVAHSMGNRAVTDALELLALRNNIHEGDEPVFGQIFFAAPDVDAGLFKEMLKTIRPLARRTTLYVSQNDWALEASRKLHGNAPRAGQGGEEVLNDSQFDTVDMSILGKDMLAHTYFANDSSALADIMSLIWLNPSPSKRCGLSVDASNDVKGAWIYDKYKCPEKGLIGLISHLWTEATVTRATIKAALDELVTDKAEAATLEQALNRLVDPSE
ncbi:alpha/beta hydrolase [Stappia sp. BW2]|nr:alpha/beta hydrolase [Stappia sp. BW2]